MFDGKIAVLDECYNFYLALVEDILSAIKCFNTF